MAYYYAYNYYIDYCLAGTVVVKAFSRLLLFLLLVFNFEVLLFLLLLSPAKLLLGEVYYAKLDTIETLIPVFFN